MSLIEQAERQLDEGEAVELERKLRRNEFGSTISRPAQDDPQNGPPNERAWDDPGFGGQQLKGMKVDERELDRIQAIILSMTPEERKRPELIKGSRRLRIARGRARTCSTSIGLSSSSSRCALSPADIAYGLARRRHRVLDTQAR